MPYFRPGRTGPQLRAAGLTSFSVWKWLIQGRLC